MAAKTRIQAMKDELDKLVTELIQETKDFTTPADLRLIEYSLEAQDAMQDASRYLAHLTEELDS